MSLSGLAPPSMTLIQPGRCLPWGRYPPGSRANRAGARPVAARGGSAGVFSVALCRHRGDLGHRDHVEFQGTPAGGVHRLGPVAFDQPQQPVHLPHPGPRQLVIEQTFGIDADISPVAGRGGDQPSQVPHRVAGLVSGQVSRSTRHAVGPTKGRKARSVPVPEFVLNELSVQCADKAPEDLVFSGRHGGYLPRPKSSGGWFAAAVKRAKVQSITPHGLRHTCASLPVFVRGGQCVGAATNAWAHLREGHPGHLRKSSEIASDGCFSAGRLLSRVRE